MTRATNQKLLERLARLRDKKDWYVAENKRLREKVRNQAQKLKELEDKLSGKLR